MHQFREVHVCDFYKLNLEWLYMIVCILLCSNEQLKDAIVLGSSSDAPQHATNGLDKEKRLSNCNLETVTSEKTKDCSSIPTEHCAILNPSLNLQGKKTGNSMVVKVQKL